MFNLSVVGTGLRFVRDVAPVLKTLTSYFQIIGLYGLQHKSLGIPGLPDSVSIDEFDQPDSENRSLVLVSVPPSKVPAVLERIRAKVKPGTGLIVDTPIFRQTLVSPTITGFLSFFEIFCRFSLWKFCFSATV